MDAPQTVFSRSAPAGQPWPPPPDPRFRDLSGDDSEPPWSARIFEDPADLGPDPTRADEDGNLAVSLKHSKVKMGMDASQNHPNPATLMWRRYRDEELGGVAIYAGFSEDQEVVGLFIAALDGKTPITARNLAKVSIDGMRRHWRTYAARLGGQFALVAAQGALRRGSITKEQLEETRERVADRFWELYNGKRPGRAGRSDAFYADVAVRYSALAPMTKSPVKALAVELDVTESAARNLVYDARRKGFLTPARAGRGGGAATEAALAALEQTGED